MREIKFRAWNKVKKEMITDAINNCVDSFDLVLKHPQIYDVMQYTGLKDKDNVEIYEGDIVKYTFDLPGSLYATENGLKVRIAEVFWCNWRSAFAVYGDKNNKLSNNDLFRYVRNGNRVEVIGNKYKNPELLSS